MMNNDTLHKADTTEFLTDVLAGLNAQKRSLPCKYFYDQRGSRLFDDICDLPEYYLTRTEQQIMADHAGDMADRLGSEVMLLEFGSGSSLKTRLLLDQLHQPACYVPLDVSGDYLLQIADELRSEYPQMEIRPVVADFTQPFDIPYPEHEPSRTVIYFPGSTIGNFQRADAENLLQQTAESLRADDGLLIGFDLQKDVDTIEAAYNDSQGVTDEFNLNILHRINRDLDGTFDVESFRHVAFYNSIKHRIEIYIESLSQQQATIAGQEFEFSAGERILTEHSHKYTVDGFASMASRAGFELKATWTDDRDYFAVLYFTVQK